MILSVFTVYDEKAEAFLRPFFMENAASAKRTIANIVNGREPHLFKSNSSDFTLFEIGTYDDSNGQLKSCINKSLGNLVEFRLPDAPNTELSADEIEKFRKEGEIK